MMDNTFLFSGQISTITDVMVNDGIELASNAIEDISGNYTADMSC